MNRCGRSRAGEFGIMDETAFGTSGQSLPDVIPVDDDDEGLDFYADASEERPQSRYTEARGTRSDFGLYDELVPYLADNEVVAMIEVGFDVDLDDVYHLVHGTWSRRY